MKRLLVSLLLGLALIVPAGATAISAGETAQVTLPLWNVLTMVGTGATCVSTRLSDTPGSGQSQGTTSVSGSSTVTVGPYATVTRHSINCAVGSLTYSYAPAAFVVTGGIIASDIDASDTPNDEECLTYEGTGPALEWQACGSGGGLSDGDKGDVAVTGSGAVWTVEDLTCTACIGGTEINESTLAAVPTATALAANGANCSAGSYPLGVDASGAAESCTVAALGDVVGPASATADKFPLFSGTTGKLIKNNSVYGVNSGYLVGSGEVSGYLNGLSGAFGGMGIGNSAADKGYLNFYVNGTGGVVGLEDRATNDARLGLKATTGLCWVTSGLAYDTENCDIGLLRAAPGIVVVTDGTPTGMGWTYEDGNKALNADFTSTSATPANLTGLTVTLKTGRKYTFRMALRFADSTAADGARFDFDGGTATATDFGVNCQVFDSALLLSSDTTALATDITATTTTGASSIKCDGSFTVNAAGTFIPRAGQEAASGGTLTVETGSYLHVTDTSFN